MHALELDSMDARFSIKGERAAPDNVVIAGIDEQTFSDLRQRFPFPRSVHATAIDNLRKAGAAQIAYDVQFTEPTTAKEDNALLDAVGRTPHVVLATSEPGPNGTSNVFGGDQVVRELGARVGNTQFVTPGGVIRRLPYSVSGLKGFPIVVVEARDQKAVSQGALGGASAWIDYDGPPGTFDEVSFSKVVSGDFRPETFRGKTVVVGATAPNLQDVHSTPTTGEQEMSGPEVLANAIDTVQRGFPLQSVPVGIDLLLITLLGFVAPVANMKLPPLRAFGAAVAAGLLYLVVAQLLFNAGKILPVVYPVLALVLASIGALAVNYLFEAFGRQRARDTFARFVPESVVDQVLKRSDEDLRLGATRADVTVMFSDIRGFTTFSESREVGEVIEVLNQYLSEMSDAIMAHGGTLVSYMGDGIMAMFGAPLEQPDHADRALAAAREMLEVRLPRFNEWMHKRRPPGAAQDAFADGFRMGIGLNSGPVMSGQVGSATRLDYTAIGDTVNTASRLEGLTKGTEHQLFVAESTKEKLGPTAPELLFVAEMPIRGRATGIKVWTMKEPAGP
jgi:adenylate cyclase